MSLPAVLKTVGLVPGVVAIALVALITDITAGLLLRATDATDANTYGDTMRRAVGGWAATTLQVAVVVNNLGLNIVYLIIMGDCLAGANGDQGAIAGILGGESAPAWATDRVIIMGASCALILAPLCVVRSIDTLRFSSYLSAVLMALFVVVMCTLCAKSLAMGSDSPLSKGVELGPTFAPGSSKLGDLVGMLTVFAVMMNSYVCHYNVHALRRALPPPQRFRMRSAVRWSLASACSVYVLAASAGYALFGEDTKDDALDNLSDDRLRQLLPGAAGLATTVKLGYALSLMCTYPAIAWEVREAIVRVVWRGGKGIDQLGWPVSLLMAYAMVGVAFGISIGVPNIWIAFSFTGATVAVIIGFVMPALSALRTAPEQVVTPTITLLLGFVVCATGVGNAVYSIVKGNTSSP